MQATLLFKCYSFYYCSACVCVSIRICMNDTCVCTCPQRPETDIQLDSLGLEVQEVMSHPAWVPGNGTGVLWNNSTCSNFWDISPACFDIFIFYNLLHGMVAGGGQRTSSSRVGSLSSVCRFQGGNSGR